MPKWKFCAKDVIIVNPRRSRGWQHIVCTKFQFRHKLATRSYVQQWYPHFWQTSIYALVRKNIYENPLSACCLLLFRPHIAVQKNWTFRSQFAWRNTSNFSLRAQKTNYFAGLLRSYDTHWHFVWSKSIA